MIPTTHLNKQSNVLNLYKNSSSNVFSMNSSLPTVNYMYIKRENPFLYKWFKLNDSVLNCVIHCIFNICVLFKYTFVWILYKYDSFHMWRKLRAVLFPYSVFFNMNGRHAMIRKSVLINLKYIILSIFNIIKRRLPDDYQTKTKKEETDYIRCYI